MTCTSGVTPRTKATFGQLLDKWRHVIQIEVNTARGYRSKIKKHIRPPLGKIPVGAIDSEILESFYAELARCRHHCDGKQRIDHRTPGEHECGSRCRPHQCRGLADSTIRQIHWIISGALDRAVRWKWVGQNPADNADKPSAPHAKPDPPSVDEAARLVAEAAKRDLDWGAYVWCSMTLGARRGELCALRWNRVDFGSGVVTISRALYRDEDGTWQEKDTKTEQTRRGVLDDGTIDVLRERYERARSLAAVVGIDLPSDAYVFSAAPDGCVPLNLDTVSQHAAWTSEADQRAAATLTARMPKRHRAEANTIEGGVVGVRVDEETSDPYQRIASDLRGAISCGALMAGEPLPAEKALAAKYDVAPSTAHRAVALLADEGLVEVSRGRRAIVVPQVK